MMTEEASEIPLPRLRPLLQEPQACLPEEGPSVSTTSRGPFEPQESVLESSQLPALLQKK